MVTLVELPGFCCPYCGRGDGVDTPWAAAASTLWGWCGVKITNDEGRVDGLLLLGPHEEPGRAVVRRMWVRPGETGSGYGSQLVQAAAAGLVQQKAHEVLAVGSKRHLRCEAPPGSFLRGVGFSRSMEDRLWHLDLDRAAVAERNGVRTVIERIFQSLRPVSPPNPARGLISGRSHR